MSGDMSYQSWKSFMLEKNYSFELYRAVNGEIIYLHTVTDGNAVQAVLMLTINAEAFQNLSRNMDAGNGIVIHNHCGEAIYSSVPQLIPPPRWGVGCGAEAGL